jgi:MFS family permease
VTTLLFIINWMDRQVMAVVLEPMKQDLGFSDAQMASLQTVFMISIGAFALPVGLLVDRWSRRKMLALLAFAWSVMTFLTGLVSQIALLWIIRFFVGVGEAGYKPGSAGWLSVAFPREGRARAIGILDLGIPVGAALGVVIGGAVATATGSWRIPFFTFAIPGIVLAILCLFLPDYATVKTAGERTLSGRFIGEVLGLLKIKTVRYTTIASIAYNFVMVALISWAPAFFMRGFHLTEAAAGKIAGLLFVVGAVGVVGAGWLGDFWHRRNPAGRALACAVVAILMVLVRVVFLWSFTTGSLTLVIAVGVVDSILATGYNPLYETMVQDPVTPRHRASSMGMLLLWNFVLGAAWGPLFVGLVSDAAGSGFAGLQTAFWLTMPVAVLCPFFHILAARNYVADTAGVKDEALAER